MHICEITDLSYERAVRAFAIDGDDLLLHEALAALGFDPDEIQAHVDQPGHRVRQGIVAL